MMQLYVSVHAGNFSENQFPFLRPHALSLWPLSQSSGWMPFSRSMNPRRQAMQVNIGIPALLVIFRYNTKITLAEGEHHVINAVW